MMKYLYDGIDKDSIEIDTINFSGPLFKEIDNRLLALVMGTAQIARNEIISTKNKINSLAEILSPSYIKRYSDIFDSEISLKTNNEKLSSGSTTHISIIDSKGNAASATTTNGAVSYTHLTLPTILLV